MVRSTRRGRPPPRATRHPQPRQHLSAPTLCTTQHPHLTPPRTLSTVLTLWGVTVSGFLSVILQVLVHNPLLRNYFLSDLHNQQRCTHRRVVAELKDGGGGGSGGKASICLGCDVDDLFAAFYSGDHSPFGPQRFLVSMWAHAEHLSGYAQQDAHELYMSLLDGLHHYTRSTSDNSNAPSPSGLCALCRPHGIRRSAAL